MTKEQIQKEINEMDEYIPVSKIEEKLGMPTTTLQKVLKGNRELPKKWVKVLNSYFIKKVPEKTEEIVEIKKPGTTKKQKTESDKQEKKVGLSSFEIYRNAKLGIK